MNMNFKQAVDSYFSEHRVYGRPHATEQPSRHHSVKNNRGWHLSNVNGYLGSINKRGDYFIVKSRENK